MSTQEKTSEENLPIQQTPVTDMPLGDENPNPGALTDKGAPYVTEGSRQAADEDHTASKQKTA